MRAFPPVLFIICLLLTGCGSPDSQTETASTANAANLPRPLPDAGAIIDRMITQDGCKDFTAEMRLTAEHGSGKRDHIEFRVQRKYTAGQTSTFLTVISPAEEADKALLAIEKAGQPTEAFSYLPGLRKLAKFGSGRQLGFRGTRVTVQEMLLMELGQYTHSQAERVNSDGRELLRVEFKEKEFLNLAFPRIAGYFHEKDQSPARFEFFDSRNDLQKTVEIVQVKTIQDRQTVTQVAIDDRLQKLKINVETRKVEYDSGLSEKIFTEDHLKSFVSNAVRKPGQ